MGKVTWLAYVVMGQIWVLLLSFFFFFFFFLPFPLWMIPTFSLLLRLFEERLPKLKAPNIDFDLVFVFDGILIAVVASLQFCHQYFHKIQVQLHSHQRIESQTFLYRPQKNENIPYPYCTLKSKYISWLHSDVLRSKSISEKCMLHCG